MTTTIKLKNGTGVPTAGALVQGEPAFDLTNKRLYTENAGGTVIEVGTNPSTLSVTGSATVGSTLGVTGAAIFSSTVAGAFNGTLGATTPASVAATTLSTTGAVTFGGALDVTGTVTADGLTVQTTNGLSAVLESANSYQHLQFKNSGYIENYIDFTNRDFNITCDNVNRFTINGTTGAATFSGGITTTGNTSAGAASAGDGRLFPNNSYGAFVYGNGTIYDVALGQRTTGVALGVLAGTTNVVIPTGNVGIGTSSPDSPLEIQAATNSSSDTTYLKLYNAGENVGHIDFENGNGSLARITGTKEGGGSSANEGILTFSTAFDSTLSEVMRINADAKVDVGAVANQTTAVLNARFNGAAFEFGHGNNGAGYYGTAGAYGNNGQPYIGFSCYSQENLNLFTTNGAKGNIITGDLSGNLTFAQITTATAVNQSPVNRMTLDASGNLLVGTTSAFGTTGTTINPAGLIYSSADGDRSGQFDRTTNDGEIVRFSKAGTTVGSIGTGFGLLTIGTGTGNLLFENALVAPCSDSSLGASNGVVDLGASTRRFKDLYLSGGVYLGGTGAANLLNDYETGVFTPTLSFGGASVGITYSNQYGRYTKVGRQVTVQVGMYLTSKGTSTGGALVSGLPFNVTTQAGGFGSYAGTFKGAGMASLSNATNVIADENTTTLLLEENNASGASALTNANFTDATYFMATITYFN
jgi:hypothetical protein